MSIGRHGLRSRRVQRVAGLYVLARIPAAALWLSVVLDVSAASGSYARAGGAVAAYGVGVAVVAPFVGRLADRHGARRVLLACTAVQLPALLLLAATAEAQGPTLLLPALLAGAAQPPLVPCMRAAWKVLVPDDEARRACLAFDAVLGEVVDLASPLIAVAVNLAADGPGSLPVVAVASSATLLGFIAVVPVARQGLSEESVRSALTGPVLAVLAVIMVVTSSLGAVEVGAIAVADTAGRRSAAGVLLAVFAAASVVGGLLYARRRIDVRPTVELLVLTAVLGGGLLAAALAGDSLWVTGVLLAVAGTAVAPLVTVLLGLVEAVARPGAETLTFTFATTANFVGVAAGSAVAGAAADLGGPGDLLDTGTRGLLVGALLAAVAVAVVGAVRSRLPERLLDESVGVLVPAADGASSEALVAELEDLWRRTREVGRANDALARELAALRLFSH